MDSRSFEKGGGYGKGGLRVAHSAKLVSLIIMIIWFDKTSLNYRY